MAKYKSVPHEIEAFQFRKDVKVTLPKWFVEAAERNEAQVTMSEKYGDYICIYARENGRQTQMERAYVGDWICRHANGKIFVLDGQRS